MTELGVEQAGPNRASSRGQRPKLSLDGAETPVDAGANGTNGGGQVAPTPPELTSEPDVFDTTRTTQPSAKRNHLSVARQTGSAGARRVDGICAASSGSSRKTTARATTPRSINVQFHAQDNDTEPSGEYEEVEGCELETGAVEPELSAVVKPTVAKPAVRRPATAPRATHANNIDRPAERHPYQVRAAQQQAARRQLESQILNAATPAVSAQERKEQAIARALAAVQPIEQESDVLARNVSAGKNDPKLKQTRSKRNKHEKVGLTTGHRFALAFGVAALAVTGLGLLIANSIPDISLQVAAMQVGIDASYPSYIPRGYSMTEVASSDGKIILTFSDGENEFTISESQSAWDTTAVLNNYVKTEWGAYTTTHENGITVYINNSNAAWVNGGIFYTIECDNNSLTKKQLLNIVAGL